MQDNSTQNLCVMINIPITYICIYYVYIMYVRGIYMYICMCIYYVHYDRIYTHKLSYTPSMRLTILVRQFTEIFNKIHL